MRRHVARLLLTSIVVACCVGSGIAGPLSRVQPASAAWQEGEAFRGVLLQLAEILGERGEALRADVEWLGPREMRDVIENTADPEGLAAEVRFVTAVRQGAPVEQALGAALLQGGMPAAGPTGGPVTPIAFRARLTGGQEVPRVMTAAFGLTHFRKVQLAGTAYLFSTRWEFFMSGPLAPVAMGSGAHLHQAPAGANGPIVLVLSNEPTLEVGNIRFTIEAHTEAELLGALAGMTIDDLAAEVAGGNIYINLHTEQNPSGEIRGQLE